MSSERPEDDATRIMLDIETLGLDPGAAILSIGACTFDTDGVGVVYLETDDGVLLKRADEVELQ